MILEFGKYTDITNFAKKVNPTMFEGYEKVYICPDTQNWWLSCINKDLNEDYETEEGKYLVERADLDYPDGNRCSKLYLNSNVVRKAILDWEGDNWDNYETDSLEEAIEVVDGGYGIIEE